MNVFSGRSRNLSGQNVKPDLAYMLKKKGYDVPCISFRWDPNLAMSSNSFNLHHAATFNHNSYSSRVSAPTYFDVVEWLHGKNVEVHMMMDDRGYTCAVSEVEVLNETSFLVSDPYDDYDSAISVGIAYALNTYIS